MIWHSAWRSDSYLVLRAGVGLDLDELSSSDDEVSIGLAAQVRAEVSDSADSSETGSGEARNENMESKETGSGKPEDTPEQLSSDTNDSEDKSTSSGTQLSGLASSAGGEEPPHSESNSGTSQQSAQASSRTETSNTGEVLSDCCLKEGQFPVYYLICILFVCNYFPYLIINRPFSKVSDISFQLKVVSFQSK